jgi:hypothetical protein
LQRETPQVGAQKSDFPHQAPEAINQTPVVNDPHTAFRHELKCQRIDTVFGLEDTHGESFFLIARVHADRTLRDDRPRPGSRNII